MVMIEPRAARSKTAASHLLHEAHGVAICTFAAVACIAEPELAVAIVPEALQRAVVQHHARVVLTGAHGAHRAAFAHVHGRQVGAHLVRAVAAAACIAEPELAVVIVPAALQRAVVQHHARV